MSYERGDVVMAADPFEHTESGRPFLIVSTEDTPFHGEQYIAVSLTTRTWYEDRIPLTADHWLEGGAPKSSSIMPWSVTSLKHEWIDTYQGRLRSDIVDRTASSLADWILT